MNEMIVIFNEKNYIAKYNNDSGYYEIELETPEQGGIYNAEIQFTDLFENIYEEDKKVQILIKEKIKIEMNKVFMWIFDGSDFAVKDIVEIADYEINIDEETNANSTIKVLKKTTAKSDDIVSIKKNNEVIYWGVIEDIQNEDGKKSYEYILKYITNIFNQNIALYKNTEKTEIEDGIYRIKTALNSNALVSVADFSTEDNANIELYERINTESQKWEVTKNGDYYLIKNVKSGKVMKVDVSNYQNNTSIKQYHQTGSDSEKWSIIRENNYYRIKTYTKDFYVSVNEGNTQNGTDLKIYEKLEPRRQTVFYI